MNTAVPCHGAESRAGEDGGLRAFLPAAALLLAGLAALAASWLLSGDPSGQYLVITSPTSSLSQSVNLVRRGGGTVAAVGGLPNVVIAGSSRAAFPASLRKAGAWLAVPVPAIAGCGAPSFQEPIS